MASCFSCGRGLNKTRSFLSLAVFVCMHVRTVCVCGGGGPPLRLPPAGIIKHDLQSLISSTSCHLDQRDAC